MKRCLMLDVDGVLVHGRNGASWATDIERDLGIDPGHLAEAFFATHWPDVIIGRTSLHDALNDCLPRLSDTLSAEDFIAYWFERDSMIDEAVLADMRTLKAEGLQIYLATNQEHQRARYLMQVMGFAADVDGIIYSAEIGEKKPHEQFFAAAERYAGARADEIVFVDDSAENISAARQAGWTALQWSPGQRLLSLLKAAS